MTIPSKTSSVLILCLKHAWTTAYQTNLTSGDFGNGLSTVTAASKPLNTLLQKLRAANPNNGIEAPQARPAIDHASLLRERASCRGGAHPKAATQPATNLQKYIVRPDRTFPSAACAAISKVSLRLSGISGRAHRSFTARIIRPLLLPNTAAMTTRPHCTTCLVRSAVAPDRANALGPKGGKRLNDEKPSTRALRASVARAIDSVRCVGSLAVLPENSTWRRRAVLEVSVAPAVVQKKHFRPYRSMPLS